MLGILHPATRSPERRYIYDVLLREFLGLDYAADEFDGNDVRVFMIGQTPRRTLSLPDVLLRMPKESWLSQGALPREPLHRITVPAGLRGGYAIPSRLPVLYGSPGDNVSLLDETENGLQLAIDIFGSAFFMLTRYEELVRPERDVHGRFPTQASSAYREGFLERPLVNEYLEILWAALLRLWPGLQRRQRSHRVLLSHDVDEPFSVAGRGLGAVLRSSVADIALRRDPGLLLRRLRAYADAQNGALDGDPANTFDFVMDTSEWHGRQSAFYFMDGYGPNKSYALGHPWLRALLRRIYQRGHEIGVHPSYGSYDDREVTRKEVSRLRRILDQEGIQQDTYGGRQHYLQWRNPLTWENWEAAGLDYDSTLGYADRVGFRCGVCYEYPAFSLEKRQKLSLRERPLIAMEVALVDDMKLGCRAACERILGLNAISKSFAGDFTLLWHNSSLITGRQKNLYREIARGL